MNELIIPSTKLRVVTVHKLQALQCLRRYFWIYVLNLQPRTLVVALWFGGLFHVAIEQLLLSSNVKKMRRDVEKEDKKRRKGYIISTDLAAELAVHKQVLTEMALGLYRNKCQEMRLSKNEIKLDVPLYEEVHFCCTLDGIGTCGGKKSLFEFKTASQITPMMFKLLAFDKQIHGYKMTSSEKGMHQCVYCVARKPSKRVKKGQSVEAFIAEIRDDLNDPARRDFYYAVEEKRFGRSAIDEVSYDLAGKVSQLLWLYRQDKKSLLDPHFWPREDKQCSSYGQCPFFSLCSKPKTWHTKLGMFQQREMLHAREKEELSKDVTSEDLIKQRRKLGKEKSRGAKKQS